MQYAESLLGIALIFAAFAVQAKTQKNPDAVVPAPEVQMAHTPQDEYVGASKQTKETEEQAAKHTQRGSPDSTSPYQTPLGAYNNGGYFGE